MPKQGPIRFGILLHCGFLVMAVVLAIWMYRNKANFEITQFYDTLIVLMPLSFLCGVAIGIVVERVMGHTSVSLVRYFWICNMLAYCVVWLLTSVLQFSR